MTKSFPTLVPGIIEYFIVMMCHPSSISPFLNALLSKDCGNTVVLRDYFVVLCGSFEIPFFSLTLPPGSLSAWRKIHLFKITHIAMRWISYRERISVKIEWLHDSHILVSQRAAWKTKDIDKLTLFYKYNLWNTHSNVCS